MKILYVEDNLELATHVTKFLSARGHQVSLHQDGINAAQAGSTEAFDAVILDIGLPGCDGLEVARRIRLSGRTPWVCMLSARSEISDKISGLEAGADDYMAKPFSLEELAARLLSVQRRQQNAGAVPAAAPTIIHLADLKLDLMERKAYRDGQDLALTPREFNLLRIFVEEPGRVFDRYEISERVWQRQHSYDSRTVEVYIGRLRKKLDEGREALLENSRGNGYFVRSQAPA